MKTSGAEVGRTPLSTAAGHPSASDAPHYRVTGDYDPDRVRRYRGTCACGSKGPWRVTESEANYDVFVHVGLTAGDAA